MIGEVRFRPTRGDAYDMSDVDRFLDELVTAARSGQPVAGLIAGKQFRALALRQGYARRDVDAFLAHVAGGAAAAPVVEATPADPWISRVENARFSPVRLREAYDMGDVDRLLDELARGIRSGESLAPIVASARLRRIRLREGYDVKQVDAFLEELAGPVQPAG
jgi:DivIVA domain-containing protein